MSGRLGVIPLIVILTSCAAAPTAARTTPSSTHLATSPAAVVSPVDSPQASPSEVPATAQPTAAPAPPPALGLLVDLLSSATTYRVTAVNADGIVAFQRVAGQRTPINGPSGHAVALPYVSTTLDAVYYLDGDSTLRGLHLDGSAATAAPLQLGSGEEGAFAVSPDDARIAVSVLDFNRSPVHVTLYTDALAGGSRKVIFESDTNYVWPVAWLAGSIVLAHAYGPYEEDIAKAAPGRDNPYSAISYHVVNPLTAARQELLGSCTVSGPLSPMGSGCIQGGAIDWHGETAPWSTTDWGQVSSAAALSPRGDWMAATRPDAQTEMGIWRRDGTVANYVDGPGVLDWAGWLDDQTIVIGSYRDPAWQPEIVNVIKGGVVHTINASGFFAATLPVAVT